MLNSNPKKIKRTSNDTNKVLLQAVQFGDEILVKDILSTDEKFHYNFSDQFGCTPVYYACRYGHLEILKILLDAGASKNIVTRMCRTPLQVAACYGHADCVKHLINCGVNLNEVDAMGMTALHWAAENDHKNVVEILIQSGAELNIQNKFGKTAEQLAFLKNNTCICQLFNKNINYNTEFSNYSDDYENEDIDDSSFSSVLPDSIPTNISVFRNKLIEIGLNNQLNGKDSGINLLEQYGIRILTDDESDLIVNALNCGQKAVLTEAGKLALQNTRPNIRDLFQSYHIIKKPKIDESKYLAVTGYTPTNDVPPAEYDNAKVTNSSICEDDLLVDENLTWNETQPQTSCREKTNSIKNNQILNVQDNDTEKEEKEKLIDRINHLEQELLRSTKLASEAGRKLTLSANVIKCLKNNYEIKKREAELYKMQLQNVVRTLSSKNIPIDDML